MTIRESIIHIAATIFALASTGLLLAVLTLIVIVAFGKQPQHVPSELTFGEFWLDLEAYRHCSYTRDQAKALYEVWQRQANGERGKDESTKGHDDVSDCTGQERA